jgi:hypothetical protein
VNSKEDRNILSEKTPKASRKNSVKKTKEKIINKIKKKIS